MKFVHKKSRRDGAKRPSADFHHVAPPLAALMFSLVQAFAYMYLPLPLFFTITSGVYCRFKIAVQFARQSKFIIFLVPGPRKRPWICSETVTKRMAGTMYCIHRTEVVPIMQVERDSKLSSDLSRFGGKIR